MHLDYLNPLYFNLPNICIKITNLYRIRPLNLTLNSKHYFGVEFDGTAVLETSTTVF